MTRWIAAGAVALIGGLSALVAQAIPGAGGSTAPTPAGGTATTPSTAPATSPAQPTSPPATSQPATIDPNLQPAPAPVITPHHPVATSGGT